MSEERKTPPHVDALRENVGELRRFARALVSPASGRTADALVQTAIARRAAAGGRLWLCGLRQGTSEQLHKPDFRASFGDDAFFASKQEALARIVAGLDASVCAGCRTRIFVECRDRPAPATG